MLRGFDGPGLIVVGDEDAFTSRADAERMQALVRSSRLIWLPGIGHMPNLEASDAFNTALLAFLADIAAEGLAAPVPGTSASPPKAGNAVTRWRPA